MHPYQMVPFPISDSDSDDDNDLDNFQQEPAPPLQLVPYSSDSDSDDEEEADAEQEEEVEEEEGLGWVEIDVTQEMIVSRRLRLPANFVGLVPFMDDMVLGGTMELQIFEVDANDGWMVTLHCFGEYNYQLVEGWDENFMDRLNIEEGNTVRFRRNGGRIEVERDL